MYRLAVPLLVSAAAFAQTPQYDLLIKGGHVVDAKNHLSAIRDVAIQNHKIAAVAANIPANEALRVIDARGLYVSPGLVDMHVHVYAGTGQKAAYSGDLSLYPDGYTFRTGVTTAVDAGSSGWRNFPDFKDRVIDRSKTRILAFLNIVGNGMGGGQVEQNVKDMDPKATADRAQEYRGTVVGIKTAHFAGPEWVAVDRAVEAGTLANIPVMVDFGTFRPERPYQELVLKHLRPGDISTHMYLEFVPMLDDNGKVLPYLFEARKRGIIFDVGHGGGSFVFRQAVPAIKQGWIPDSISTDLHVGSMNNGMKDMNNVMSKLLNIGESIDSVIAQSTWHPAREIHHEELGNLDVGADADVTVLRVEHGDFGYVDSLGARMKGSQRIVTELTVRDGRVVWDLNGMTRDDWSKLGPKYKVQGDGRWDGTINDAVRKR
jgi:dihydroorotase